MRRKYPISTKFDDPAELMVTRNSSAKPLRDHDRRASGTESVIRVSGNRMIITHTEVPEALRGKGVAEQLVAAFAVKYARKDGLEVVAECDYANRFLNRDAIAPATGRISPKSDGDN